MYGAASVPVASSRQSDADVVAFSLWFMLFMMLSLPSLSSCVGFWLFPSFVDALPGKVSPKPPFCLASSAENSFGVALGRVWCARIVLV